MSEQQRREGIRRRVARAFVAVGEAPITPDRFTVPYRPVPEGLERVTALVGPAG